MKFSSACSKTIALLSAGGLWLTLTTSHAVDAKQPLPLKRVVMLNSGVSYFEHAGAIEGNRLIEFPVKVDDINDLLKSLVVQDRGGGQVTAVNYGSPEPISQTLKTLAIDVTRNPSLSQIFHQLRGHEVQLTTASDTKPIQGTIVGVEHRRTAVGRDQQILDTDFVLLRTTAGLRSLPVEAITLTKFVDEKIDRDFLRALELLVQSRQQDQKSVKLDFRGKGPREVSIGYVQESPVWKITYRLVIDDKATFLQGWAIVENTTAQDWDNVNLTLMSGRPVSFQMALYQPLFASRPMVALELHSSVGPRIYNQDLAAREDEFLAAGTQSDALARTAPRRRRESASFGGGMGMGGMGGMGGGMMGGMGGMGFGGAAPAATHRNPMDLAQGVESSAATQDAGESFRYVIQSPVTLHRNESAMLPIVNGPIKGDKVYIFNSAVHSKHPMAGLKLVNSTDLHLQQGPITVFEEDEYAGDAQIADIPPGSSRLISYALDLDTEVVATTKPEEQTLVGLSIQKGGLIVRHLASRQSSYLVKNSGSRAKTLLLEQKISDGWSKISPQPAEKTRDLYRFAVQAEPGKPVTLPVTETKDVEERLGLINLNPADVDLYLQSSKVSGAVRKGLHELLQRKSTLSELAVKRSDIEKQIREASTEQQRVRENLKSLGENDQLHKRYVQKLAALEDTLESLNTKLTSARTDETNFDADLQKFAAGLSAE